MSLLRLQDISLAFGHVPILDRVSLQLDAAERVCIVGRNGEGKSTLLKVIAGLIDADGGDVEKKTGVQVGYLQQDLPQNKNQTVYQCVAEGLGEIGQVLSDYQILSANLDANNQEKFDKLMALQARLDAEEGWVQDHKIRAVLSQLELDADAFLSQLSGGWLRRVTLAKALLHEPDILLLDEPTNHLDIEMITWLEQFFAKYPGCVVFVSHDRSFIEKLATRIVEIDRGVLTSWPGNYQSYLTEKAHALEVEDRKNAEFDKKLSQEEAWIRQGIKARRTRNEGRVRSLKAMRQERANRRSKQGKANIVIDDAKKSGKLVAELLHVAHDFDDQPIIKDFSTTIMRGDRVGLIGPNGVGKTTLLKIITGDLEPKNGNVRQGTNLEIAYFSQSRSELNDEKTVADAVAGGQDMLEVSGKKKHVISYLKDFLFAPERARSPIKVLSGGERNRLLLARLFLKPSNLIIMDEPTNDLDIETLELLEEKLLQFQGTLLVVSHDRAFLDNVVTSTIVFEGHGKLSEHVGGYSDYLRFALTQPKSSEKKGQQSKVKATETKNKAEKRKRSYHEERELKRLPGKIESLEQDIETLQAEIAAPGFYQQGQDKQQELFKKLKGKETELESLYERWEALEG